MDTPQLAHLPDEDWMLEPAPKPLIHLEQIGVFEFGGRTLEIFSQGPGQFWMMGKVLCAMVGIRGGDRQLQSLPENEKLLFTLYRAGRASGLHTMQPRTVSALDTVKSRYQGRRVVLVSMAGMFRLIFQSRKPQAEMLKTAILDRLFPAVFQHGQCPAPASMELALRVPPQLAAFCPQDDDFRRLCVREQILVAERLSAVMEIEAAPLRSLVSRCRAVAATRQSRMKGFSYASVFRFHRTWCQSGRNWRGLLYGRPGKAPRRLLINCCEQEAGR